MVGTSSFLSSEPPLVIGGPGLAPRWPLSSDYGAVLEDMVIPQIMVPTRTSEDIVVGVVLLDLVISCRMKVCFRMGLPGEFPGEWFRVLS